MPKYEVTHTRQVAEYITREFEAKSKDEAMAMLWEWLEIHERVPDYTKVIDSDAWVREVK